MSWTISYYSEAVRLTVDAWPVGIRAVYARITERMQSFGPNLGMPLTRAMGEGLFEIRARGREGLGRALFCTRIGQEIVILHAFIKKTPRTPRRDLQLARERLREVRKNDPR
jgi:phage-related protein